jgi:pimeloyl-ACP methyl ester carboxylesterase
VDGETYHRSPDRSTTQDLAGLEEITLARRLLEYPGLMIFYVFTLLTMAYLWLVGARRRRLQVGPVSLVYYQIGREDAEPWVLLHGLGSVAASWGPVLRRLRRSCRMVVPELSELGGSTIEGGGLGVRQGAEVVARLIEAEFGGRPVTLVGISLGGWLATRLSLARPDLISRLVLVDAGGYRDQDWDEIERLVRVHKMADVEELYGALFARTPWIMRVSKGGFFQAYTSRAVTGVLDGLSEADTFKDEDLGRLRMPTDLIWGEKDGLFHVAGARAMAAALPNATLQVLPDCGHAIHIECPRRLAAALKRVRAQAPRPALAAAERAPSSI